MPFTTFSLGNSNSANSMSNCLLSSFMQHSLTRLDHCSEKLCAHPQYTIRNTQYYTQYNTKQYTLIPLELNKTQLALLHSQYKHLNKLNWTKPFTVLFCTIQYTIYIYSLQKLNETGHSSVALDECHGQGYLKHAPHDLNKHMGWGTWLGLPEACPIALPHPAKKGAALLVKQNYTFYNT